MSNIRVAERYASSIVGLAQEKGLLEAIKDDMWQLKSICEESRDFLVMLKSPIINNSIKMNVLRKVFKDANEMSLRFLEIITRKNRANVLYEVAIEIIRDYNQLKGIQQAVVTTAVEVAPELKIRFEEAVKQISQMPMVDMDYQVDPKLLGGFVLAVGDKRIDNSVQNSLSRLRSSLKA